MYEIRLADGSPIFYQGDDDYTAYDIECAMQKGDSGYLQFTMPKSNPAYGTLQTRKSMLEFVCNGESVGFFEVREVEHDIRFSERIYAVGELAWLFDSIQPQAEFHDATVRGFLSALINVHNAQCTDHQFRVGIVDVTDSNDSLYRYTNRETTLDAIRDKLIDRLGGQIKLRRANGVRYVDYLTDDSYGSESTQRVYFGENMLDYSDTLTVDDICTEVIPLGERLENSADNTQIGNLEKRLTIESVNNGKDWIANSTLVSRFGHIRSVAIWDDVTIASNLLAKARAWLASDQFETMHLTVKAVDLSLTSEQFGRLRMGDFVQVVAKPYGLDRRFAITRRTYHPESPETDEIELGDNVRVSFIASQNKANHAMAAATEESSYQQTQWLTEAIENVTAMMTGDRGGYKLTEYDSDGRWLADYILDSPNKSSAKIVRKVNMNGTAYSTKGINGPYETAIMANGTILGKYIQAHSIKAEQISQDYTKSWEDADTKTLNTARTEFKAADSQITARVTKVEQTAATKTELAAEVKIRADQIATTVKRGQINSTIRQTAETIYITSDKFGWSSTNSSMTTDGKLTTKNMVAENITATGTLSGDNGISRTQINGGSVNFYSRINGSWKQAASMNSYASGTEGVTQIVTASRKSWLNVSDSNVTMSANGGRAAFTARSNGQLFVVGDSLVVSNASGTTMAQAYTGSIYLTYGNGGKIYLNVQKGLITGWTV